MNTDLIYTSTKNMSEVDWLAFRKRGFGASEIGAIMGVSEYSSALELFHEKSSPHIRDSVMNMAMFMGHEMEDKIAKLWSFWDGTEAGMIRNYREGKVVRKMRNINAYIQNPKFPWLFVSLDRIINQHNGRKEGALELKTMSNWIGKKYRAGIPPQYMVQLQTQCLVCGFEYGELAVLEDGRKFSVHPFEYDKEIGEMIVEVTHDLWQKVEKAKIIQTQIYEAKRNYNQRAVQDLKAELDYLEPAPDGSIGLELFLKDEYKESYKSGRTATPLEVEHAKDLKHIQNQMKELANSERLHENYLKNSMKEVEALDMGVNGMVYWKENKNRVRVFRNNYID